MNDFENMTKPFESSVEFARSLDSKDSLSTYREQFHIPCAPDGEPEIYFVGNSLGLQPKQTELYVVDELTRWKHYGVRGHFSGPYPWMPYHEFLTDNMANLVGCRSDEVVMMNSLTANLHLMMASFYRPAGRRTKILIEAHAFPSDHYAVESQIRWHGLDPQECLVLFRPRNDERFYEEDLYELIESCGEELALILLPGVQYYTGQVFDMKSITEIGHRLGITVGFDLAHAAGNVELNLHDWNVDFAAWCSYKYLNSGPGSIAGCFVHQRHANNVELPRLAGWWGHDKSTRFQMKNEFQAIPTAEGWQLSNPPILSLAAIRSSLDLFQAAGGMPPLVEKSQRLSEYFRWLIEHHLANEVEIITPDDVHKTGCQLSLKIIAENVDGKKVHEHLESLGVMTDWREPNVIRAAPVPLYNTFEDVYRFVTTLQSCLAKAQ